MNHTQNFQDHQARGGTPDLFFSQDRSVSPKRASRPLALADSWLQAYRRRQQFRQAIAPLLEERDQILADIGYDRRDILWALSLPLKHDAQAALEARR